MWQAWRARHHTPALVVAVIDSINEVVVVILEQLRGHVPPLDPLTSLTTEICEFLNNFYIYHRDNFSNKSKCFDYGDFVSAREIEDIIGVDVGIVPTLRKKARKKSLTRGHLKGTGSAMGIPSYP